MLRWWILCVFYQRIQFLLLVCCSQHRSWGSTASGYSCLGSWKGHPTFFPTQEISYPSDTCPELTALAQGHFACSPLPCGEAYISSNHAASPALAELGGRGAACLDASASLFQSSLLPPCWEDMSYGAIARLCSETDLDLHPTTMFLHLPKPQFPQMDTRLMWELNTITKEEVLAPCPAERPPAKRWFLSPCFLRPIS